MEKKTQELFNVAYAAGKKFDDTTKSAFARYRTEKEKAKSKAAAFKDEEGEYKRLLGVALNDTRNILKSADIMFSETVKKNVLPKLRAALASHITASPSHSFLDALRIYREFGLKLSKMELQGFLTASEGNFTALRALQAVAKDSGFNITFDDLQTYEKDIFLLENLSLVPTCYVPRGYSEEGDEIYPEATVFRADGSVAYFTKKGAAFTILTTEKYEKAWEQIQQAGNRWNTAIVPAISEYKPIEEENGSPEEQRKADIADAAAAVNIAEENSIAQKFGELRAEEAKESTRILGRYGAK